ncbi:transposase [Glycomyces buryatensis]|uniref:Transposase n=1 Tax=Glycomyces buryatensis TaxID=2570927 RepID=A0A4S8PZB4_9ACTN|nr:transposase [Glycomyces buryatensis]THV33599.1 transposase [Glycomyces buryatensis]
MSSVAGRGDLTDKQWARLRRWIPTPAPTGRPITRSRRVLFNGVAWRVRVGSPWRDVPERYGPLPTAYQLFAAWQQTGVWAQITKLILALLDVEGHLTWTVSVDSTTIRAHQAAAGARHRPAPGEPDDHALGRSRGEHHAEEVLHSYANPNAQLDAVLDRLEDSLEADKRSSGPS